jgi:hypothetical protein
VLVVVFSGEANDSKYVLREIETAVSEDKILIPVRIEKIQPSKVMKFLLGPHQWIDAFPALAKNSLRLVLDHVKSKL